MVFKRIREELFTPQFLRFVFSGGIAFLVNFGSRFLFRPYFSYVISVQLAFILGTIVSFILNKYFTFKAHDEKVTIQMGKFIIIALVGIALASGVAWFCVYLYNLTQLNFIKISLVESIAHIISIGVAMLYNFFAMKYFSFKKLS